MTKRLNRSSARERGLESAAAVLRRHFAGLNVANLVTANREYPELARSVLDTIESRVRAASSYRGKVLSLEAANHYGGAIGPIRVHKLKQVAANQLVLPQKTVALLDRNVIGFIAQREQLKSLGLA